MKNLNIVLLEPEIAPNVGNIARTCACTGASLHLIEPLGFEITDKHLKRAGLDYWPYLDIRRYKNIDEFYEKTKGGEYFYFTTKAPRGFSAVTYPDNCYIIFGKESAGIPEEILKNNLDRCVRIPMVENLRSLNLANSVAASGLQPGWYPDSSGTKAAPGWTIPKCPWKGRWFCAAVCGGRMYRFR